MFVICTLFRHSLTGSALEAGKALGAETVMKDKCL